MLHHLRACRKTISLSLSGNQTTLITTLSSFAAPAAMYIPFSIAYIFQIYINPQPPLLARTHELLITIRFRSKSYYEGRSSSTGFPAAALAVAQAAWLTHSELLLLPKLLLVKLVSINYAKMSPETAWEVSFVCSLGLVLPSLLFRFSKSVAKGTKEMSSKLEWLTPKVTEGFYLLFIFRMDSQQQLFFPDGQNLFLALHAFLPLWIQRSL